MAGAAKGTASTSGGSLAGGLAGALTRAAFVVPYAVNQLGSLLNTLLLRNVDTSVAGPVVNALTLAITALVETWMDPSRGRTTVIVPATALVAVGVYLCLTST